MSPHLFPTLLSSLATENHAEISHAAESPAPFPRTARKEAPSLATSWRQQAACHVPRPTSHVPTTHTSPRPHDTHVPTSHLPSPGAQSALGMGHGQGLGFHWATGGAGDPTAPICTGCRSGAPLLVPKASVTQPLRQRQWVYACVTRARIWPRACRSSLRSRSRSGLSHTPQISPRLQEEMHQEINTTGAMMCRPCRDFMLPVL